MSLQFSLNVLKIIFIHKVDSVLLPSYQTICMTVILYALIKRSLTQVVHDLIDQ